jgi:hypothetical protein
MKQIIFLLFFLELTVVRVFADSTFISNFKVSGQSEANILWRKFIDCGNQKKDEKFTASCLKDTVSESTISTEASKAFEFLNLGFEVTGLTECSNIQKQAVLKSKNNEFLCFKILGNRTSSTGYVYFERKQGTLKISKIKY